MEWTLAIRNRVSHAFHVCYSRPPDDREIEAVIDFQKRQAAQFKDALKAAGVVAPKQYPEAFSSDVAASWTAVARVMINTDVFVTRE